MNKRLLTRLVSLLLFSVLALCVLPETVREANGILPRLSPLLNLGGALGARQAVGWWLVLGFPLLVLPFFKGRLFCWWVCPMGFVAEQVSRVSPSKVRLAKIPWVGKGLALVIVVSACAGYPLLIWLDPLCIFNGFFAAWRMPLTWVTATLAAGFLSILVASLIAPNVWCHRLCPLGGLQEWLTHCARALRGRRNGASDDTASPAVDRRVLLGFAVSGAAGLAARKVLGRKTPEVIRPPGAVETSFNALCARCGNCMKACPYGLIVPDLGETGIDGLLTPVIKFRSQNPTQERFCFQECVACTKVCPTGAIRMLSVAQKKETSIGVAKLDKVACIAWEKKEYCVVCQEYCPYQAVIEEERNGVQCPTIDESKCRGCGACESQCPALPIAIIVKKN
jgi:ferredoxin